MKKIETKKILIVLAVALGLVLTFQGGYYYRASLVKGQASPQATNKTVGAKEVFPDCLKKILNSKKNWRVTTYDRLKNLYNVINGENRLVGRFDGDTCLYSEKGPAYTP